MSEESLTVKRLVVVGVTVLALGAGIVVLLSHLSPGFHSLVMRVLDFTVDEDQAPIIVRNGSVIFEGGDSQNPKKGQDSWVKLGSNQQWKAIKNKGHHVASFTVYVGGVADPNPTTGCPQTTMTADSVEVDYDTGSTTQPTTLKFHVRHTDDGSGHHSPEVDADDASGLTAGATTSGSAPPQLLAGAAGQGWISKVIATDASGALATCTLPQSPEASNRALVRITIVPERK